MTVTLIATPAAADANSYLTLEEADEIMDAMPHLDEWGGLDDDEQARILIRGTRLIDGYKPWGVKYSADQALRFPRKIDGGNLTQELKLALAEFADAVAADEVMRLKTMQAEGVVSTSVLGQSLGMDGRDESRLPAGTRVLLDRLYEAATVPRCFDRHGHAAKKTRSHFDTGGW